MPAQSEDGSSRAFLCLSSGGDCVEIRYGVGREMTQFGRAAGWG